MFPTDNIQEIKTLCQFSEINEILDSVLNGRQKATKSTGEMQGDIIMHKSKRNKE